MTYHEQLQISYVYFLVCWWCFQVQAAWTTYGSKILNKETNNKSRNEKWNKGKNHYMKSYPLNNLYWNPTFAKFGYWHDMPLLTMNLISSRLMYSSMGCYMQCSCVFMRPNDDLNLNPYWISNLQLRYMSLAVVLLLYWLLRFPVKMCRPCFSNGVREIPSIDISYHDLFLHETQVSYKLYKPYDKSFSSCGAIGMLKIELIYLDLISPEIENFNNKVP